MKTKCYWLLVSEINLVDIQTVLEYDTLEIEGDFAHCFSGQCSSMSFNFIDRDKKMERTCNQEISFCETE